MSDVADQHCAYLGAEDKPFFIQGETMQYPETKTPTHAEIEAIERQAHVMRAQAVAHGLSVIGQTLTSLPRAIVDLFTKPRHA